MSSDAVDGLVRRLSADRAAGGGVVLIGAGEIASRLSAEELATALERAPDDNVAMAVCFLIGHYDTEPATAAVPRLIGLLDSDNAALRAEAADAIAHAISRGALPSDIRKLMPEAEKTVRAALDNEADPYAREMLGEASAGLTNAR